MIHLLLSLPESRTIELLEINPTRDVALHRVTFEEPTLYGWQPTERNDANEVTASQRLELVGAPSAYHVVRVKNHDPEGRWVTFAFGQSEEDARRHYDHLAALARLMADAAPTDPAPEAETMLSIEGSESGRLEQIADPAVVQEIAQAQAEQILLEIKPADWAKDLAGRLVARGIAATPEAVTLLPRGSMDALTNYVGDLEILGLLHGEPHDEIEPRAIEDDLQLLRGLVRGVQVTKQDRAGQ